MKANETTFQHVIEETKQYIVPLFQRPYCWDKSQWETLWNDLVDMQDVVRPRSRVISSNVTLQSQSVPAGQTCTSTPSSLSAYGKRNQTASSG